MTWRAPAAWPIARHVIRRTSNPRLLSESQPLTWHAPSARSIARYVIDTHCGPLSVELKGAL